MKTGFKAFIYLFIFLFLIITLSKKAIQKNKISQVDIPVQTFQGSIAQSIESPVANILKSRSTRLEGNDWLTRLESFDCERFFIENVTNGVPELKLYQHIVSTYSMSERDRFKVIRRAYEGGSASIQFTDLRDEAVDSVSRTYREWFQAETNPAELARLKSELAENLKKTKDSFDRDIEQYRSSTIDDIRDLIPDIDDGLSNLIFAIQPKIRASSSDLVPINR
ncbi:MAG: hypothetical protein QE510_01160 [Verrucomicrobiota bacterium]|jgi:hypothetical protein|nr:hypothetical protein [Verrucomicrobiota bacterium]